MKDLPATDTPREGADAPRPQPILLPLAPQEPCGCGCADCPNRPKEETK